MLTQFSDWISFDVFGLSSATPAGEGVQYFINDSIKILLLLIVITHVMSVVRFYLPVSKIQSALAARRFFGLDYAAASFFGAVTPFCSCSSIPLFVGFLRSGIPLGLTFAFLITSPLINEVAVVLFLALFGWKVTLLYVAGGVMIGVVGGYVLGKLRLEGEVADFVREREKECRCKCKKDRGEQTAKIILKSVSQEAFDITGKILPYVLAGVAIGAVIHGYVPAGYFEERLAGNDIWSVPLAVIFAVPLYSNASGVIPVIQSLVEKGVPLGTALAFMMAVVGLSLPEALILKKVLSVKLLAYFFGVVTVGIILMGYGFNLFV